MTTNMIQRLVFKDWYFNRRVLAFYLTGGAVSLFILGMGTKTAFYAGSLLFISTVIGVGVHLVMNTVVLERKEKTLAFIMSLPVSASDYTWAKVIANLGAFLGAWGLFVIATVGTITYRATLPNGLTPFAVLLLGLLLTYYCLTLGIALVSESEAWTIAAVVTCNLTLSLFMHWAGNIPEIASHIEGPTAVWNGTVGGILLAQVSLILLILGTTFYLQGRKRDFL